MYISLDLIATSILRVIIDFIQDQSFFSFGLTCKRIYFIARKEKREWKSTFSDDPRTYKFIGSYFFPFCVCGQGMNAGALFKSRKKEEKKIIVGPCCTPQFNSKKECERCGMNSKTDYCSPCHKLTLFSDGKYFGEKWSDVIPKNPFYVNNYIDFNPNHRISKEIRRIYGQRCSFTKCFDVKNVKVYLNEKGKICRVINQTVDLVFSKGKMTRRTKDNIATSTDKAEIEKKRRMIRGWLIRDKISKSNDLDFDFKIEQNEVESKEYVYL
jgi:hypothetical protein